MAAIDTTFWQQLTAMVGLVVGLIIFLVVFFEWRRRHPINSPSAQRQLGEEVERRRAEMAEAEVRALHQANLALHEELDRLRRQLGAAPEHQP